MDHSAQELVKEIVETKEEEEDKRINTSKIRIIFKIKLF